MAKARTVFFCQNCGAQSAKWIGRCPSCGEWNTYVEEVVQKETAATTTGQWKPASTVPGGKKPPSRARWPTFATRKSRASSPLTAS
jgi:predicted ATP-dependent serine protease